MVQHLKGAGHPVCLSASATHHAWTFWGSYSPKPQCSNRKLMCGDSSQVHR